MRVPGLSKVVEIGSGSMHSVAVKGGGAVRAWGSNRNGQLSDGTTIDRLTRVAVSGLHDVVEIAGGGDHNLAVRS